MIRVNRYNTTGAQPAAQALERKLAELAPLKHFVATGFARNGLFLLARALGWDASAEIIIPAFTCPVIRHTIESAGAMPVPVDAEPDGLNIDADLIEKAITDKTRAVYVVHTYGTAAHMERICAVAKRHNLAVIEDVAHAPFYRYRGRQLGTWGDFAVYSFTKKLVNYEGGAIGTNDTAAFREMMRRYRWCRSRP
ncbi:MAG TPA: aminotransferase class I/II-fold pyridoxal phosphate-dependent enzyme, partial [Spirochaetota bacterium]|nr:aminotransferase class I/II-fold pyridoxal phosphate-dependent enzyme [Spirochaetota bacterium]